MKNALRFLPLIFVTAGLSYAQTQLIGVSSVQATRDNNSAGQAEAYLVTASVTGSVTTLSVYLDATNAKTVYVGLYSNSNGHPTTLLGAGTIASPVAGRWNTVNISPGVQVTAGTAYHIAVLGTRGLIQYRDTSNGTYSETSRQTNLTSLPAAWSSGSSWQSGPVSAYGSGAATGGAANGEVQISILPAIATVNQGGTQQFTAAVSGTSNTAVNWSVTSGTGAVSTSGLFTAPYRQETDIVQAQSKADLTKTATASITVPTGGVQVSISPSIATVNQGATQQFTATVTGTPNTSVNWSVTSGTGTVSTSGMFTGPNRQESDTVRVQAQADSTKTASASITVPAVGIQIAPTSATVSPSSTQQFTSTVTGTVNKAVTWSKIGNGTITQSGLYTAPPTNENDTVTAKALASPSPSSTATVSVQAISSSGCGNTLNWTNSQCQQIAAGSLDTAMVNGVNDPNAWTVVSRHGEYMQAENECNVPGAVSVANGALTIKTKFLSTNCGDFDPTTGARCSGLGSPCPGAFPYTTGDVQWNTFSFKYGVVVFRAQFPTYQTSTWPAVWMLGSNCQNSNKYTGDTGLNGCPNVGHAGYVEIDNAEFAGGAAEWGRFNIANPDWNWAQPYATAPVDGNYHVFGTVWTATGTTQYMDDQVESSTSQTPNANMFLIVQTQTGGMGGNPISSLLPAYLNVDYVKVCNSNYSLSQCENAAPTDPNVIFWDDFGGPAQ